MADVTIDYRGQRIDVLEFMSHIVHHEAAARYSPWFSTYYRDLTGADYMSRYLRQLRNLLSLRPEGIVDQRVLDAGCGFGIMAVLMSLMGAQSVDGLDCHEGMIDTFRTYLGILPLSLPIQPRVGDVGAMPYEDESFDVVVSHEAISHYEDVDRFLTEVYRVLRPGGALILSDSNNGCNRRIVREIHDVWEAFEHGPSTDNLHGHKVEKPFVVQRAEIIEREFPALSREAVEELSRCTSGLAGQALLDKVARYVSTGEMPTCIYRPGTSPIDPVQGYYIEYLFDPYELAGRLQGLGFRTQVRAYLGGARGGVLAWANRVLTMPWLTRAVMPHARAFRLLAVKA